MSSDFKVLKVPIGKEKSVFYYYKRFKPQDFAQISEMALVPPEKTLYMCHFLRPIEESFISKYMQQSQIKRVELGQYKNKATNSRKGKRRTIYFALIVLKTEEYLQSLLKTDVL